MRRYTITCSEEQLRLISAALEDYHRFLAGECSLEHATSVISPLEKMREARRILDEQVRPFVVPGLSHPGASYDWAGSNCPNEGQRQQIAMSYGIYREILHFFAVERGRKGSVYYHPTLTCEEQGPLIHIESKDVEVGEA